MCERPYTINHVMSKDIESGIFTAILQYFREYSPAWLTHVVSAAPIDDADLYHYHRPHLESRLMRPAVCTVHHDLDDPDVWHARQRFVPRYLESAAVVCLNETQRAILLEEGLAAERLCLVPHGYNDEVLRAKPDGARPEGAKVALGIASRRYGRRVKGEAYLYELFKRLDPDVFRFVLVGQDRSLDAIELRRLGFDAEVYERLPYRLFQGFYEAIDALLMCSSHEGGPANIPEALATGTPVFASPVGMAKDFVRHGENGLILMLDPDTDAPMIADTCAAARGTLARLRERCIQEVAQIPTWRTSIEQNLLVYSGALGVNLLKAPPPMPVGEVLDDVDTDKMLAVAA